MKQERSSKQALPLLRSALTMEAKAALQAAADDAAAWLVQGKTLCDVLSPLTRRQALSEQWTVTARGRAVGRAAPGAAVGQFRLHVASLAQPQLNLGFALTPDAPSVISPGTHQFSFHSAAGSAALQTTLRPTDTNADALKRLCASFNEAKLGAVAAIQEAEGGGTIRLTLCSRETGKMHAFRLEDISGGSVVRAVGIDRTAQPASDAVYSIDEGDQAVSSNNDVMLASKAVTIALDQIGADTAATVTIEYDRTATAERLEFVAMLVNALEEIFRNASGSLHPLLMQGIDEAMAHPGAAAVGLRRAPNGMWQLDAETLQALLNTDTDDTGGLLTGPNGFASALQGELSRLASLPTQELINDRAGVFQAFMRYGSTSETYLQLHLSGFRVDAVF